MNITLRKTSKPRQYKFLLCRRAKGRKGRNERDKGKNIILEKWAPKGV
jgi:hypothetical protein